MTIHILTSEQIGNNIAYSSRTYSKTSWDGLDGLTNAMVILSEYHTEHKKSPNPHDYPTIARMCENMSWKRWDVTSWDDLMRRTFSNSE